MKYVVKHIASDMYLTDSYYKTANNRSSYLNNAHLFTAFELKLASNTALRNKEKYRVYKYKQKSNKEVLLDVETSL